MEFVYLKNQKIFNKPNIIQAKKNIWKPKYYLKIECYFKKVNIILEIKYHYLRNQILFSIINIIFKSWILLKKPNSMYQFK